MDNRTKEGNNGPLPSVDPRMPLTLSQRLADAWRKEGAHALESLGPLGEESHQVIQEALLEHAFQATFHQALGLLSDKERDGVGLIQREAERLACLHSWIEPTRPGREMVLLALPCGTNAANLSYWLQEGDNRYSLGSVLVEHLAECWALSEEAIERVVLFPAPVSPEAVAALSSDGRRKLVEEMMQRDHQGPVFQHLQEALIEPGDADPLTSQLGSEGLLLFAVGVHTEWSSDEISDPSENVREMLQEQIDPAEVQLREAAWLDRWTSLPDFPLMAYVPQPTSLTRGLMQVLQARVMNTRLAFEDPEQLVEQISGHHDLQFAPILRFQAAPAPADPLTMEIKAWTTRGALPAIEISTHWALAGGPVELQVLLTQAFDLSPSMLQQTAERFPYSAEGAAMAAPSEPLHPAWQRALPPAPGLH